MVRRFADVTPADLRGRTSLDPAAEHLRERPRPAAVPGDARACAEVPQVQAGVDARLVVGAVRPPALSDKTEASQVAGTVDREAQRQFLIGYVRVLIAGGQLERWLRGLRGCGQHTAQENPGDEGHYSCGQSRSHHAVAPCRRVGQTISNVSSHANPVALLKRRIYTCVF